MNKKSLCLLLIWLCFLTVERTANGVLEHQGVNWVDWSNQAFDKAEKENRLIVLNLEAVWCHWCHVMAEKTYGDKRVQKVLNSKFVTIKVDQDSRPDISKRYEEYGWPATIFFDSKGREIGKRSGFFPPEEMLSLTEKLIRNPKPEEEISRPILKVPPSHFLNSKLKASMLKSHLASVDQKRGGWGDVHKFLFGESEELALRNSWRGDKMELQNVSLTLNSALQLMDPVWGGVYQYSVRNWKRPHFEKIAESQMRNLFLYSLGYSLLGEEKYLKAAKEIRRYLNDFLLAPNGGYYTSQDADIVKGVHSEGYFKLDNEKRRAQGIPIIDKHQYARENGWFIYGLASLYAVSHETETLQDALNAASWVEKNRALGNGGYSHDEKDASGPYLSDTLEMANAFLKLYEVTADRNWLKKSTDSLSYIGSHFSYKLENKAVGFLGSVKPLGRGLASQPDGLENIKLARVANLAGHYSGIKAIREIAEQAMRFVAIPDLVDELPGAGMLLADSELSSSPVHITIIGPKSDPAARALYLEALKYPTSYKRVEWWDRSEGPLPNSDVQYPTLKNAAAFACNGGRCSLPFTDAKLLRSKIDKLY